MDASLHYLYTRKWFPNMRASQARRINSLLDNRSRQFMSYPQYDVLGLGKKGGHRRYKHDMLSAAAIGSHVAGRDGMAAAVLHQMCDKLDERVKEVYGSVNRDLYMLMMKKCMMERM
jgi:hypothetical protein